MARDKQRQSPSVPEPYTLGLIGGAAEFEWQYPDEMMKLGCLTAYWSLADETSCQVLALLLRNSEKVFTLL
jgi:hypothetical protein